MSSDQLPHLETFVRVAELNSFTAAARALSLTQAAVSQRVQALERELGSALFRRRGGRVLPTEAGQRLYPFAQRILALHGQARQELTGLRAVPEGELTLSASSVPGEQLLPDLLSAFRVRHPHVRLRVTVGDSESALQLVEQGRAHLGLVGMKGESPHLDYRGLAADTLALVVPAGHPWARRRRVTIAQLCGQSLILREAGSGSRRCLEQALAREGKSVRDLAVALELGSSEAIKEAVLRGLGMAVLSTRAVRGELEAGRLHALAVAGLPLRREMYAVWDRRRVLPPSGRLFLDLLGSGDQPGGGA
jgi:LysR family transcriptional regulator, low CO2-responsive transcriptional regulator